MSDVLTLSDLGCLEVIARAAQSCAHVRWLTSDGDIADGIARHLVKSADVLGFLTAEDDVRDAVLRVTTTGGFEAFLPVRDLMAKVRDGEFVIA